MSDEPLKIEIMTWQIISKTMISRLLVLVRTSLVGLRGYTLSSHWEGAISGWQTWLKTGGMSDKTRSLRRDHVRTMARRSKTLHPRQMTLPMLVELCREQNWS